MNSHVQLVMDKRTFLDWIEEQEHRFELKDQAPMMMAGGTRLHGWITSDLESAIKTRIDRLRWRTASADVGVEIGDDIRYPDVVVESGQGDPKAKTASMPVLIAEVLSASSIALDMNVKAAEYMSLASLETYIVAAQDEPRLWVWNRSTEAGRAWPKAPLEVHGRDNAVPVPSLGVELPMAEIYAALPA